MSDGTETTLELLPAGKFTVNSSRLAQRSPDGLHCYQTSPFSAGERGKITMNFSRLNLAS